MTRTEERLSALEERLRRAEDELAVTRLIASYGPLVDSGSEETAALWEPDGVYDVDALVMEGREDVAAMVRSGPHQRWITGGSAHFSGPPHVTVDGDEATAVSHSLLVLHGDGRFTVRRATANHWRLRRSSTGRWQVVHRTGRVLDGRPESRALLARAAGVTSPDGATSPDHVTGEPGANG